MASHTKKRYVITIFGHLVLGAMGFYYLLLLPRYESWRYRRWFIGRNGRSKIYDRPELFLVSVDGLGVYTHAGETSLRYVKRLGFFWAGLAGDYYGVELRRAPWNLYSRNISTRGTTV